MYRYSVDSSMTGNTSLLSVVINPSFRLSGPSADLRLSTKFKQVLADKKKFINRTPVRQRRPQEDAGDP